MVDVCMYCVRGEDNARYSCDFSSPIRRFLPLSNHLYTNHTNDERLCREIYYGVLI